MRVRSRVIAAVAASAVVALVLYLSLRHGDPEVPATAQDLELPAGVDARPTQTVSGDATAPATVRPATGSDLHTTTGDDLCIGLFNEAAAFAWMESGVPVLPPTLAGGSDWAAEARKLKETAHAQSDQDHLLAALTVGPELEDQQATAIIVELADRSIALGSPMLAWHALRACFATGSSCPFTRLEPGLLDLQRDNAEAWALVATHRYQAGDTAGALEAMRGAARASTSNWHWPETVAAVERAFAMHTSLSLPERIGTAFSVAQLPALGGQRKMCEVESRGSRTWAEACLALADLRAQHNETELGRAYASSLRARALQALGEPDRAAEVLAEEAQRKASRAAASRPLEASLVQLREVLISTDPERLRAFLDSMRLHGEVANWQAFLRQHGPALMERAGLLGRTGAKDCVARLLEEPVIR